MSDQCNNMVDMALDLQSMDMELLEVEERLDALHLKEEERDLELEEMVRCAACSKVSSTSPIFNCPTGHLLCSSCYRGSSSCCPRCKRRMGKTVSLLAEAVIGSLKLACCKNPGCGARLRLGEMEEHKLVCAFRMIACPVSLCATSIQVKNLKKFVWWESGGQSKDFGGAVPNKGFYMAN